MDLDFVIIKAYKHATISDLMVYLRLLCRIQWHYHLAIQIFYTNETFMPIQHWVITNVMACLVLTVNSLVTIKLQHDHKSIQRIKNQYIHHSCGLFGFEMSIRMFCLKTMDLFTSNSLHKTL